MGPTMRLARRCFINATAILWIVSGCTTEPGEDSTSPPQREHCTLKVAACINTCYEADLGFKCKSCCDRNGISCDRGGDYAFLACPDEQ